ncbi:heterokaryon incompatibility protein-domain-containing protein [Armillaria luteobubalina]|uniref:Heterokaryon incompatibility protein-domain-containing protein n=1 Tax=Armillaria luteobubalina TaxID=153913 RepID=A0AA39UNF9_9AGAR|nr:heterokaryon incompatibility protein-domain-containing protein [Armillaria luteobubalina]
MEHLSPETQGIILPTSIPSEYNDGIAESSNSCISTASPEVETDQDDSDVESSDSYVFTGSSELETDWSDSDVDSASGPAVEDVPPEIWKLVCENCWRTVFTSRAFRIAWETRTRDHYSDSVGFSYKTPTWKEIQHQRLQHQEKYQHECQWCKLICWELSDRFNSDEFKEAGAQIHDDKRFKIEVRFCQEMIDLPHLVHGSRLSLMLRVFEKRLYPDASLFEIHAAHDNSAARFVDHRPVLLDVASPAAYSLIKERMDDCLLHECCRRPQTVRLPTRVIDCKDPDHPCLFVSNGMEAHYAVLSYVWGESQPHCTTTLNLESYIDGIPLQLVPKTITDAIMVAQRLGLRYLWVDAFCIIQDSKEDKAREIVQIRRIFRDAYLAIIAACAQRVSDGFLRARSEEIKPWSIGEIISLPFLCPDGGIGTIQAQKESNAPLEPTSKRAWCLEERMLSRHKLIYTSQTLLYECRTKLVNVNGSIDSVWLEWISYLPGPTPADSNPSANDEMTKIWKDLLAVYTSRRLTKPRDRLIAFSGIVDHFQGVWPHSKYIAGLWSHQLPEGLLWRSDSGDKRRPQRYRAPSWSWASTDGEITLVLVGVRSSDHVVYSEMSYAYTNERVVCTVQLCDVEANAYGEVTGGSLVLDTVLWRAVWDPVQGVLTNVAGVPTNQSIRSVSVVSGKVLRCGMGRAYRDATEPVSEEIGEVYLAIVIVGSERLLGLVLVPATTNTQEDAGTASFRRIGLFNLPNNSHINEALQNSEYQRITII